MRSQTTKSNERARNGKVVGMRRKMLLTLLLGSTSTLAVAQTGDSAFGSIVRQTTTNLEIKLYVSVGNVDLTRTKTDQATQDTKQALSYVTQEFPYPTGGIVPELLKVDAYQKAGVWLNGDPKATLEDTGHSYIARKPVKDGSSVAEASQSSNGASKVGAARVTVTGTAKVRVSDLLSPADVELTDVLVSEPTLSGDQTLANQAAQDICTVTAALKGKTIPLSVSDMIAAVKSNPGSAFVKKITFDFLRPDEVPADQYFWQADHRQ